jgi:hypothetical protein
MRNTMLATMAFVLGLCGVAAADAPATIHKKAYVAEKSDQVLAAFLRFAGARGVEEQQNRLEQARERDALMLPGGAPSMRSGAMGAIVLGAAVVLAAHAPARLRAIVDGPVHFGPALFEGGGMGAGVGARF